MRKLKIKDVVMISLLTALYLVFYMVASMIVMVFGQFGHAISPGICAILTGSVLLFLTRKVGKFGQFTIMQAINMLIFSIMGAGYLPWIITSMVAAILAVDSVSAPQPAFQASAVCSPQSDDCLRSHQKCMLQAASVSLLTKSFFVLLLSFFLPFAVCGSYRACRRSTGLVYFLFPLSLSSSNVHPIFRRDQNKPPYRLMWIAVPLTGKHLPSLQETL